MKQYIDLLKAIEAQGTDKPAARANMPGSRSLFGYQFRHNLADGFPLLTTKKMYWKGIVVELLWFLRGDTNIKYLVDNGVNIWNGDAYNYYRKIYTGPKPFSFTEFVDRIKEISTSTFQEEKGTAKYQLGDCGYQYGKVWTAWEGSEKVYNDSKDAVFTEFNVLKSINQITRVIRSLRETPESRRHIVTAVDPAHDTDLALYWCHSMFQFNCRPLTLLERCAWMAEPRITMTKEELDEEGVPRYYLDCQLYQRSADSILGVPFNIASYALLIHLIAKMVGMVPGEFIHTFGDAHLYDNHKEAMVEQLSRIPSNLPKLKLFERSERGSLPDHFEKYLTGRYTAEDLFNSLEYHDFTLEGYTPQSTIKAELSTG